MKKTRPQGKLFQITLLSLVSIFSVLVMASVSQASLNCTNCHGDNLGTDARPVDTPNGSPASYRNITTGAVSGNHSEHMAKTTDPAMCNRCHNNSGYTSSHRNGQISLLNGLNFSTKGTYSSPNLTNAGAYVFKNQTSVPTLGTCATVNCHFESVTPTWGSDPSSPAVISCDTCHSSVPVSLSHTKHTAQFGGAASCTKCHAPRLSFQHATSAGNALRNIDLTNLSAGTTYTGSNFQFLPSQSVGRTLGTCNTNYCHSSGQAANGLAGSPVYATPMWGNASSGACGTCHAVNLINSGSHGNHVAKDTNCGNCHTGASLSTYVSANHVDGFINVSGSKNVQYSQGRSSAPGNGYGTCNNASCHAPFTNVAPNTAPTWGVTTAGCSYCHQGTPSTGAHTKHLALTVVNSLPQSCDYCHTPGLVLNTATHIDGYVNVNQMAAPVAKHTAGSYAATCTASCHTPYTNAGLGVTPNWGVSNANNCGLCHEVSPTTGVHARHLANTALITDCSTCHAGAVANSNGGTGHMDGNIDVTQYTGGSTPKHLSGNSNYSATCTTACHNPTSTSVAIVTPTWGTTTPSCADCHNTASGDAFNGTGGPATGSHTNHLSHTLVNCALCHTGAVANSNGGTNHLSGFVNVSAAGAVSTRSVTKHAPGAYSTTCAITCHNGPTFTAPAIAWGSTPDCSGCHGYPPDPTGTHNGVNPATVGVCNSCHSNVLLTTTKTTATATAFVNVQLHLDGIVQGGKCDACHGYPPVPTKLGLVNYSGAKLQNYSGGGGVHAVAGHLNPFIRPAAGFGVVGSVAPGCVTCHPSSSHNQGFGLFSTHNVQVVVDTQFKFDKNRPIVYNAIQSGTGKKSGTCTNVACHFQKSPVWSTTYTQGH